MKVLTVGSWFLGGFIALVSQGAQAMDGGELLDQCTAKTTLENRSCESYILGALSGANMMMVGMKALYPNAANYPMLFCAESSTPKSELVSVVVRYLRANPGGLKYDAGAEVLLAFRDAFPCRPS